MITVFSSLLLSSVLSPIADVKKPGGARDFPFFSGPKTPHTREFVPGLQAALQLTAEQAEKIEAACRDTIDKPENRTKEAGGAAMEKARALVTALLTDEQKTLILKLNETYAKACAESADEFRAAFIAAKGNADETARIREKQKQETIAAFHKYLPGVLTTDQMKAVEEKAAQKKKLEADKTDKKKPGT